MMQKYFQIFLVNLVFLFSLGLSGQEVKEITSAPAAKAFQKWALGIGAGSNGLSADLVTNLHSHLNLRLSTGAAFYTYQGTEVFNDVRVAYTADLSMLNAAVLLDYQPWAKSWRLSAGLTWQQPEVTIFAAPTDNYDYGDRTFSAEKMGSLDVLLNYRTKWMPYVGIGYGNALREGSRLKGFVDLGLFYSGAPQINMVGEGLIAPTATQSEDLQEGLDAFHWLPVLRLGLTYRL